MIKFNKKEKRACKVLSHLKIDKGKDRYKECIYNDLLLYFVKWIVRVDPYLLILKVGSSIDQGYEYE